MTRGLADTDTTAMDFADCDDQVMICADECAEIDDVSSSDEDTPEEQVTPVSIQEAKNCIQQFAQYASQIEDCPQEVHSAYAACIAWLHNRETIKIQTTLDKFLKN